LRTTIKFFSHYIAKRLDVGKSVHALYLDLQKAFDKVPHTELIFKLNSKFGISGALLSWIRSFLADRRQRVKIGTAFSDWVHVESGVPQGSVLAPLLFILYVADMQTNLNEVHTLKFADDTKLFSEYNGPVSQLSLQGNLETLSSWLRQWKMSVNTKKSAVLKFEKVEKICPAYMLNNEMLQFTKHERDLGVYIDSNLNFRIHIQKAINKSFKLYGWMVRTLASRDKCIVLKIYKSIIRPNLEYASAVWNPHASGLIQQIEKVQRKVTKFILGKYIPYEKRLESLKLPSLKWRRQFIDLLRVYEILHSDPLLRKQLFTLTSEVSNTNLRRHNWALHGEICHSNVLKFHFVNRVVHLWNNLPNEIVNLNTYSAFKRHLKMFLLLNPETNPFKM